MNEKINALLGVCLLILNGFSLGFHILKENWLWVAVYLTATAVLAVSMYKWMASLIDLVNLHKDFDEQCSRMDEKCKMVVELLGSLAKKGEKDEQKP